MQTTGSQKIREDNKGMIDFLEEHIVISKPLTKRRVQDLYMKEKV